jgi:hypothetical protein
VVASEIRKVVRASKSRIVDTEVVPPPGDAALLVLNMSGASDRYGVAPDVVPRRKRDLEHLYA